MNSVNPSEGRVELTTESLNFTLDIQKSLRDLRNRRKDSSPKWIRGTIEDVDRLHAEIVRKLGDPARRLPARRRFAATHWYNIDTEFTQTTSTSDRAESAFEAVAEWVLKNSKMLAEADGDITEEVGEADLEDDLEVEEEDDSDVEDAESM